MRLPQPEQSELISLWRPQAKLLAEDGKGIITITQFLRSKGVEARLAADEAQQLVEQNKRKSFWQGLPRKIIGVILLAIGLLIPAATLFMGRGFYAVTLFPIVVGSILIWGGRDEL